MHMRTALHVLTGAAAALFIIWICSFKVVDSDFWWHIKAGEVLWRTKGMITIDPFAYTRDGLPYFARHEWLAQVVLYAIHQLGGATGVVLLRILSVLLLFGITLSVDRKNIWPNAFLVVGAAIVMRQGFIERPQLFSNVLFALMAVMCLKLLQEEVERRRVLIHMTILQIVWVNMHGGAAFLSIALLGTVFVQYVMQKRLKEEKLMIVYGGVALLVAMLISPNTYHNFTYVWHLYTDQTAEFIREWAPSSTNVYLSRTLPFWLIALASLGIGRRNPAAVGLMLFGIGALSVSASRHEILFVVTALCCTFYELKDSELWNEWMERVHQRTWLPWVLTFVALAPLVYVNLPYHAFLQSNNQSGFGSFEPIAAAYDFVEEYDLSGEMFNNYGAGGYLMYRGVPDRRVFVDGRNVDYGYDFLKEALDARYDSNIFHDLQNKYGFTYAIIEFESTKEEGSSFDFSFLNDDPDWALVFVDDWTSAYVRRTTANASVIAENEYVLITPENLNRETLINGVNADNIRQMEAELLRAIEQDDRGISALLSLAKLYRSLTLFDKAVTLAEEAKARFPARYEPYEILGSVYAVRQQWDDAIAMYEKVIELTEYQSVKPNYSALADLYEKGGYPEKALRYRKKSGL